MQPIVAEISRPVVAAGAQFFIIGASVAEDRTWARIKSRQAALQTVANHYYGTLSLSVTSQVFGFTLLSQN